MEIRGQDFGADLSTRIVRAVLPAASQELVEQLTKVSLGSGDDGFSLETGDLHCRFRSLVKRADNALLNQMYLVLVHSLRAADDGKPLVCPGEADLEEEAIEVVRCLWQHPKWFRFLVGAYRPDLVSDEETGFRPRLSSEAA